MCPKGRKTKNKWEQKPHMLVEHLSCFVFSKIVSKRKSEVVLLYALMMQTHRESSPKNARTNTEFVAHISEWREYMLLTTLSDQFRHRKTEESIATGAHISEWREYIVWISTGVLPHMVPFTTECICKCLGDHQCLQLGNATTTIWSGCCLEGWGGQINQCYQGRISCFRD